MTQEELVDAAMSQPRIKRLALPPKKGGLGWPESQIRSQLDSQVASAVQEVVLAHSWDFALKSDSTGVTSVASTADYELPGTSKDCLDIYILKYDGNKLVKKNEVSLEDILSRRTISSIRYWTPIGRNSGLLTVKITGTPSEGGKAIAYRYWRDNVTLADCPVALDYLLHVSLAKRLIPEYQELFEAVLPKAIQAYERPEVDPNIDTGDPAIMAGNNRRAGLFGWSG